MRHFILFLLVLHALTPLSAQDTTTTPQAELILEKTLQWLCSDDTEKRSAAFRTPEAFADINPRDYLRVLEKARRYHNKRLTDTLLKRANPANPYLSFAPAWEEWQQEVERVLPLIRTDYQKDKAKIAMLRNEMERLHRLRERALRAAGKDPASYDAWMDGAATALAEVLAEIEKVEADDPEVMPDSAEEVLEDVAGGEDYLRIRRGREELIAEQAQLEETNRINHALAWAGSSHKKFAQHLNEQRAILGLGALVLDEQLSEASRGHSEDMIRLRFFAHMSPVEGKKTPNDRAKLAGFQHRWTGENIFAGNASPIAAYDAWFASDGHRFIMMAERPNLLGLGPVNNHWTLMTGRRR
ncbi:MAG: CAP domain-containing protein [Verrucomicrobiota bacterium JB023]|nr:CAP domain-containing protein [Verrucomicrobiota bacterium JB023]